MSENVVEIISIIIKKLLHEDKNLKEEDIILKLVEEGYKLEDIDRAFSLLLSGGKDRDNNVLYNKNKQQYFRIFSRGEKMYLTQKLQGLIQKLLALNVLNAEESEDLIGQMIENVYRGAVKTSDLWETLNDIVDDRNKLQIITKHIPEFNEYIKQKFKYVN